MENPILSHNLLKRVPAEINVPAGRMKAILFDALTVLSALAFGFAYRRLLEGGLHPVVFLITLAAFMILLALGALLTKDMVRRFLILLLSSIGAVVFFYDLPLGSLVSASGALLVFLLWGEALFRRELMNELAVHFFRVTALHFKKSITGIVIFLVILFVPGVDEAKPIPEAAFRSVIGGSTALVGRLYPGIQFNESIGVVASDIVRSQVQGTPEFQELSAEAKENYLHASARKTIEQISDATNVALSAEETLGDALYRILEATIADWRVRFGSSFLFALGAAIFLIFRSTGVIFYWIVSVFAWLVYEILLTSNVIRMASESRSKEVAEYS